MGDWEDFKRKSAEMNYLIWESETDFHNKDTVQLNPANESKSDKIRSKLRTNSRAAENAIYENFNVEVNITKDGAVKVMDEPVVRKEITENYNVRLLSVGLDGEGMNRGFGERELEEGKLYVLKGGSADSGSGRRRASHEGTTRHTVLPSAADNAELPVPGEAIRSRSSPARRRHSQGSAMSPTASHSVWSNHGQSVPGSCDTPLADIIESPIKSAVVMGQAAVPIASPTSTVHEPFGSPLAGSPPPASPLPPLQDEIVKKDPSSASEMDGKQDKSLEGEGADLIDGHTSREGLDPETLMFRDGRRKIDMVLAYELEELGVMTEAEARRCDQRKVFQENLVKEGLELELENKCLSFDEKTWFLKIHIPWRTEARYAEVMGLKLPTKRFITISVKAWDKDGAQEKQGRFRRLSQRFEALLEWDHSLIPPQPSFYTSTAGPAAREEQFLVKDRDTAYTAAQRSLLVMQILLRGKYDSTEKVGIRRLLNDGTYLACFPLHEGRYEKPATNGEVFDRRLLYLEWARPGKWFKRQPLWLVRKYFGDRIGLYFCWLGFYTKMLYAPAIVGTLCFFYGLLSMHSEDNIPTKEICNSVGDRNILLCPLCDKACKYQNLSESCLFAQLTYLFDNPATVFFAIFMSFWATTFLELWKRKQSVVVWEWDMNAVDQDEEPRPEFETSVKTFRMNPVTREKEAYLPVWSKFLRFFITGSAVLFMITIVLGAVLGTIIYRISVVSVIYSIGDTHNSNGAFIQRNAKIFTTITAAIINLIIIMILTKIYAKLAINLTNLENPRTQNEYEDSYTFKIFLFEFMNFYSSLIYIAFFKGRFFDYPGDVTARRSEFFRLKGDVCDPAGCLSELCIQLAIIMIGKQIFNNFLEILYPMMWNWWRQRTHRANTKDRDREHQAWEQDYHLQDPGRLALFDEYLEMILQYGFVTLFVAAFPLAPLFALLNNVAEIRLDAYKMVTQARRPLAERVEDIGAWYGILQGITYAAVVSNAFVIAYTSDWIPRMVYRVGYAAPGRPSLEGYIKHSLSVFNTSDYRSEWGLEGEGDPPTCFYRGYRNEPDHPTDAYGLSPHYWHVFAARLAFVVVFEHVVFGLTSMMRYAIPDTPMELKTQRQREALLAKEAKYEHGLSKDRDTDYERVINHIRQPVAGTSSEDICRAHHQDRDGIQNVGQRGGGAGGSWARRLSRVSDGLDAHVTVAQRPRPSLANVAAAWQNH